MKFDPATFHPLGDRLVVRLDRGATMSGSLYLPPEVAGKAQSYGRVVAISSEITDIALGDLVLTDDSRGVTVSEQDGLRFNVYHAPDIKCVLKLDDGEVPAAL